MPVTISDSDDPINAIRNAYYTAFTDLTGSGLAFEGFVVEKFQDPHKGFVAPGITINVSQSPGDRSGFGTHRESIVSMRVDLIFKENHQKVVEGVTMSRQILADWYLPRVKDTLRETSFGVGLSEISREVMGQTHDEPQEGTNAWLYGCIASADIGYEGDIG